jgi:hypothetical protein
VNELCRRLAREFGGGSQAPYSSCPRTPCDVCRGGILHRPRVDVGFEGVRCVGKCRELVHNLALETNRERQTWAEFPHRAKPARAESSTHC